MFATPDPRQPGDPLRSLVAFRRVPLAPGQPRAVTLEVPPRAFTRVTATGARVLVPGRWLLTVGSAPPLAFDRPATVAN